MLGTGQTCPKGHFCTRVEKKLEKTDKNKILKYKLIKNEK